LKFSCYYGVILAKISLIRLWFTGSEKTLLVCDVIIYTCLDNITTVLSSDWLAYCEKLFKCPQLIRDPIKQNRVFNVDNSHVDTDKIFINTENLVPDYGLKEKKNE